MALITCPECGQQVSDKAEICPHCGIKIAGNIVPTTYDGHTQQTKDTELKANTQMQKKNGKSLVLLMSSFVIALTVCGTVYFFYNKAQAEKELEEYTLAMNSKDPLLLQMYLTHYADAPLEHRDSVNARLMSLSQEETDWRDAVVSGTRSALEDYVQKHPTSTHRGEAMNKIDSIDYAIASRENTTAAYNTYLQKHPDGSHAEQARTFISEMKQAEVQPEEEMLAKTVCRQFFQAINSNNAEKLTEMVTETMPNFLNRKGATSADVVTFMNKLYKDDVTNLNWHILDDFKVSKQKNEEGGYDINANFTAELKIDRTDATKEKYGKYIVNSGVTPEGKITKLTMTKIESK